MLNSISFPFQTPNLSFHNRNALLDKIKQTLTKACAMRNLTVFCLTSGRWFYLHGAETISAYKGSNDLPVSDQSPKFRRLTWEFWDRFDSGYGPATRFVSSRSYSVYLTTTRNFNTTGPGYLPSGRTHRIIIHPETRTSGYVLHIQCAWCYNDCRRHVRVLSSPTYQPGKGSAPREAYVVVSTMIVPSTWM